MLLALWTAAWLALGTSAAAAAPIAFPPLSGRVVDAANVLTPNTRAALTEKLAELEASTGGTQLVVATIPALNDVPIEDYGYQLGRAWGIGQKGKNSGAVLIVAPTDRKVRIEVGYGLEPVLTDALSKLIIEQQIIPEFRKGDIPAGIVAGTDAIIAQIGAPPEQAQAAAADAAQARAQSAGRPSVGPGALFWLAIVVVWLLVSAFRGKGRGGRERPSGIGSAILWGVASSMLNRGGRDDGWGGGGGFGGGGGGFGGGGGSFGGGGASGSW